MKIKRKILGIILMILIFLSGGCKKIKVEDDNMDKMNNMKTGKEIIISVANSFLKSKGIELEQKSVYYDEGNQKWQKEYECIKIQSSAHSYDYTKKLDVLKGRDYQSVVYSPKDPLNLVGIHWVFVDRQTKEVIYWFGMK